MATPNRSWAWDQFDLEVNQGELNILNDVELAEAGLTRGQQVKYETDFIDDLYGTNDARWEGEGLPSDYGGKTYGSIDSDGALNTTAKGRSSYLSVDTTTWGLDLRRVDNEALTLGSDDHFLHVTRGEINWPAYEKDPKYQKAFEDMKAEKYQGSDWSMANYDKIDFLSDKDVTTKQKVNWIRTANQRISSDDGNDEAGTEQKDFWDESWEGKHDKDAIYRDDKGDLFIDGERQETLSDRYAEGKGRLKIGFEATNASGTKYTVADDGTVDPKAFDPISGPPTAVVKPNIDFAKNHPRVKVPASLAPWKNIAKGTINAAKLGGDS